VRYSKLWAFLAGCMLTAVGACSQQEKPATQAESAAQAPANQFDPAKGTAGIKGAVRFEGTAPAPAPIKLGTDPVCLSLHKTPLYVEDLLVSDGKLENTFVYVKEGLEKYSFAAPREPVTLDQRGCRFEPHIGGIMTNQDMRIINDDPTLHNVRCVAEKNPQFNIGQPLQGGESVKRFASPEVMVHFRCDVHKWMNSYFGILPHPYYAVSGKDGAFALKNLPPGEYVIEAWHEKLGTQTQKITVGDGETKEIGFTFKASAE